MSYINNNLLNDELINDLDECSVCCALFINKFTSCDVCKNCVCLDCYNKIKSFNIRQIPFENEERGILYNIKCPFCTNITIKNLSHFDKEEILNIALYDYIEFANNSIDLNNEINEINDDNNNLKKILNYNENNKITNYIIEKQNNEIIKLKKDLEDKNNMYKIDVYKFDNNRLITENMELKKENMELKKKYIIATTYFQSIEILYSGILDNIKNLCTVGKSKKIDKQIIFNEANKKFDLNINITTK